jgi:hypothetical protein
MSSELPKKFQKDDLRIELCTENDVDKIVRFPTLLHSSTCMYIKSLL